MGQAEHTQFTMATAGLTREREKEKERERRGEWRKRGVEWRKQNSFHSQSFLRSQDGSSQEQSIHLCACKAEQAEVLIFNSASFRVVAEAYESVLQPSSGAEMAPKTS